MRMPLKSSLLLLIGLSLITCKDDDNAEPPASTGPPSTYTTTFDADISGNITDDFDFSHLNTDTMTNVLTFGYTGNNNVLNMGATEPGTSHSLVILGNRESYGEGQYVSDGSIGYGSYSTTIGSQTYQFFGTYSSITIDQSQLIQETVGQTYLISGSFEMTAIDPGGSGEEIEVSGTFSNAVVAVEE